MRYDLSRSSDPFSKGADMKTSHPFGISFALAVAILAAAFFPAIIIAQAEETNNEPTVSAFLERPALKTFILDNTCDKGVSHETEMTLPQVVPASDGTPVERIYFPSCNSFAEVGSIRSLLANEFFPRLMARVDENGILQLLDGQTVDELMSELMAECLNLEAGFGLALEYESFKGPRIRLFIAGVTTQANEQ